MSKNKNLSGGLYAARPTPLTIKETPLSAQIAEWLDARGIENDRLQCGQVQTKRGNWMKLCKPGTPDRYAIIRGQIIYIEVKMRDKRPTPEQKQRHIDLIKSGAVVIVCDSFDNFTNQFNAIRAHIETRERERKLYD